MRVFNIDVAGVVVGIRAQYSRVYNMCREFIISADPDFAIESQDQDFKRAASKYEAEYDHEAPSDVYLEEYAILEKLANILIDYDIFLMHGAAIALDNNAYLFSGKSGVGKTTHIRKWLEQNPNTYVVNGDKPFIKCIQGSRPLIYGTPWCGKEEMRTNTCVPLYAIIFLERAEENRIYKIPFSQAFLLLYQQAYRPEDEEKTRKTLQMLKSLDGSVDFYKFQINNFKDDCFQVAYDALINGQKM